MSRKKRKLYWSLSVLSQNQKIQRKRMRREAEKMEKDKEEHAIHFLPVLTKKYCCELAETKILLLKRLRV